MELDFQWMLRMFSLHSKIFKIINLSLFCTSKMPWCLAAIVILTITKVPAEER